VYYLDLTGYYIRTTKQQRAIVRKGVDRNKQMEHKLKMQKNQCFWCGDGVDMSGHLDHVLPIYRGGTNNSSNLVASCKKCNLTKGTEIIQITNEWTIKDYKKLQLAYSNWMLKPIEYRRRKASPKKVQLYGVYRARLFKEV